MVVDFVIKLKIPPLSFILPDCNLLFFPLEKWTVQWATIESNVGCLEYLR